MGAERLGSSLLGTASGPGTGIACGAAVPGDPQPTLLSPCRTSSTVPSRPCRPAVETAPPWPLSTFPTSWAATSLRSPSCTGVVQASACFL